MIARGSLGNPWIFERADRRARAGPPGAAEIEAELLWVLDRAAEHWGADRAARNLRKLYPWYVERLGYEGREADRFQRTESLDEVRELLAHGPSAGAPAAPSGRRSRSAIIAPPARPASAETRAFRAFLCREPFIKRRRE